MIDRSAAQELGDRTSVERRRHDEEAQVVAYERLRLQGQREAQIGVEAALMKLVEDDEANVIERRVALQAAREHALRHDFDPRAWSDTRVAAHAIADGLSDLLTQELGESVRGRSRGEPSWLEHHDRAVAEPLGVDEDERHSCRLAGSRGSLQNRRSR